MSGYPLASSRSHMPGALALLSSNSFPAMHHSEEFNRVCHPAYRFVVREYLPEEWVEIMKR